MKKATLCFPVTDTDILLAMKKKGFGEGKWNGFGGKVEEGETERAAAVRELEEESGLVAAEADLEQMALVRFFFEGEPKFECYVYLARAWSGEPMETEEMRPHWYPRAELPFDGMWVADGMWLPLILDGEKIEATVNFNTDGSEVKKFSYTPATFAK